ncbi:hypothetical protein VTN00DRAFT_2977 [Thermoascus crustaceus]|uniref:uncharacterized protein n=1 Tax=Thermoascus crustaceus TaxID=5088 RepID=UPI00374272EF
MKEGKDGCSQALTYDPDFRDDANHHAKTAYSILRSSSQTHPHLNRVSFNRYLELMRNHYEQTYRHRN